MKDSVFRNLSFEYIEGDSTPVRYPTSTGWRQMPCWVIVVLENNGVTIETREHGKIFCPVGRAILTPPNLPHCFSARERGDYISHWSHVRFTLPGDIDIADFLEPSLVLANPQAGRIKRINLELAQLKKQRENLSIRLASRQLELGFTLLSIISSNSREKNGLSLFSPEVERIRELLIDIDRHLHEELDRDDLARRANLSPSRFHVVFEQIVGLAPMAFVKRQRMKKAQILLSETPRSIKEIGCVVGYPDAYTFSRAFKNTVGVSPRKYREQSRKSFTM